MKALLDKFGFLLIIAGAIVYLISFKVLIVYGTDYYIHGSQTGIVTIVEKNDESGKIIYTCRSLINESTAIYKSAPTTKEYPISSVQQVIISPTFKIVMFGKILLMPYLVSMIIMLFLVIVSTISVRRIFRKSIK